jgi:2-polyprenyl-3-methyl-5-hydroxy-6-metoxy-1,4-benzoquinol methylase
MDNLINFFNKRAQKFSNKYYKVKNFKERYQFLTNKSKNLLKNNLKKNIKILDYGCGDGTFSIALSYHGSVTAVDGSKNMIKLAKRKMTYKKNKNINFILSDLNHYTSNKKFELVFCSSVMEYLENFSKHLDKLHSSLNKNGTLLLTLPNSRSFYRAIELFMFKLFNIPKYYNYIKLNQNENYYRKIFIKKNFLISDVNYFSDNLKILDYLGISPKYKSSMILFTLKKKN